MVKEIGNLYPQVNDTKLQRAYDSDDALNLLKKLEEMKEEIANVDTSNFINLYLDSISMETRENCKISEDDLKGDYLPNIDNNLLPFIETEIAKFKNIVNAMELINSQVSDVLIQTDGKVYFILAQYAYTTYDDYENMSDTERMNLRDGGILFNLDNPYAFSSDNWDIARSSCSACASFNAIFNLLTPAEVSEVLASDSNLANNAISINSLNAGILLGINELLKNGDFDKTKLINNRYLVTKEIVNEYFSDVLTSDVVDRNDYLNDKIKVGDTVLNKEDLYNNISEEKMTMVVRLERNDSGRYQTDSGHYVAVLDYKVENGREMVFVADSAIPIPERTTEYINGTDTNRLGWVPLDEFETYLRADNTFTIITRTSGDVHE